MVTVTHDAAGAMDAIYRTQRHFYDLTRKYYLLGRDTLVARLRVPERGSVLEIGCGTGRNLIAVARAYPSARCFGIDISSAMLQTARGSVGKSDLDTRIALRQGDATAFDPQALFGRPAFDRVVLSYTLSMIPGWRAALVQAATAVAPGGSLHIVDFGQQERLPRWFRALLFAWLGRFDVTPRRDLKVALTRIADDQTLILEFRSCYHGYAWAAVLKRPSQVF